MLFGYAGLFRQAACTGDFAVFFGFLPCVLCKEDLCQGYIRRVEEIEYRNDHSIQNGVQITGQRAQIQRRQYKAIAGQQTDQSTKAQPDADRQDIPCKQRKVKTQMVEDVTLHGVVRGFDDVE